jgi:hypothetical protein
MIKVIHGRNLGSVIQPKIEDGDRPAGLSVGFPHPWMWFFPMLEIATQIAVPRHETATSQFVARDDEA